VVLHMMYDEWGNPQVDTEFNINKSGVSNLNNYTGYEYDDVLGIYYAQNRFYDAGIKRFVQEDPIKDGMNWYAYVGNNPINKIDPTGLAEWMDYGDDTSAGQQLAAQTKTVDYPLLQVPAAPAPSGGQKASPDVQQDKQLRDIEKNQSAAFTQKAMPGTNQNKDSQHLKTAELSAGAIVIPYVAPYVAPAISNVALEILGISISALVLEEIFGHILGSSPVLAPKYPINTHAKMDTYYNHFECEGEETEQNEANQKSFAQEFAGTGNPNPEPPNNNWNWKKVAEDWLKRS